MLSIRQLLRIEGLCLTRSLRRRTLLQGPRDGSKLHLRCIRASAVHPESSPDAHADATDAQSYSPSSALSGSVAFGRVMASQANFVRVSIDRLEPNDSAQLPTRNLLCVVRALLKKINRQVLVGDHVRVVGIDWPNARGVVEEVLLPRESQLSEPPVANVNHALLVFSLALPPMQPSSATRYLVTAEAAGLPITIVLNKADLLSDEEAALQRDRIAGWGYKAVLVSVLEGRGIRELEEAMQGKVTVVAGPSGAGKSSIINALRLQAAGAPSSLDAMAAQPSGREVAEEGRVDNVQGLDDHCYVENDCPEANFTSTSSSICGIELQTVGDVSERIGRGKHTTRNVALFELGGGGFVVDTPGFNQPSVSVPPTSLGRYFPEIQAALQKDKCAFSNCQHILEPGCVVRGDWERYEMYAELHGELREVEEETSKRAVAKRAREGTVRFKSRAGGQQQREARLDIKSHRRISRRSVKQKLSQYYDAAEVSADEASS